MRDCMSRRSAWSSCSSCSSETRLEAAPGCCDDCWTAEVVGLGASSAQAGEATINVTAAHPPSQLACPRLFAGMCALPLTHVKASGIENSLVVSEQNGVFRGRANLRDDRVPHVEYRDVRIDARWCDVV